MSVCFIRFLKSEITIVKTISTVIIVVVIRITPFNTMIHVGGFFQVIQFCQINLPPQGTTNSTKSFHELCPLGRTIRDELEVATKILVVFGKPFHQGNGVDGFQFGSRLIVSEPLIVGLLFLCEMKNLLFLVLNVSHRVPLNVEVVPDYQVFHGTHFESPEGVVNHETVLPRVLGNLVKIFLEEFLFLHQFDVGEGICGELNGLVESVLSAIAYVDHLDDNFRETLIKKIGSHELTLKVGRTGQDNSLYVGFLAVRHE
mmetsp:Transcript_20223/g.42703  ORF Transcript_20223/g.42703 Transcript_20223/m.42703 type:complete len:258 (+) Transcript_20223:481-1254(+)